MRWGLWRRSSPLNRSVHDACSICIMGTSTFGVEERVLPGEVPQAVFHRQLVAAVAAFARVAVCAVIPQRLALPLSPAVFWSAHLPWQLQGNCLLDFFCTVGVVDFCLGIQTQNTKIKTCYGPGTGVPLLSTWLVLQSGCHRHPQHKQ